MVLILKYKSMKQLLTLLFAFMLVAGTVQAQSNPANFSVDVKDVGTGLSVKILGATPCGSLGTYNISVQQYFGEVPNLWVEGAGWEGQEDIGTILAAHPTWNFYGVSATGYCQKFYNTTTTVGPMVNGYYTRGRLFTGTVLAIYNAVIGQEFVIPYNDFSFNYVDANNSAYPTDLGFGAGIMTTGEIKEITIKFNNCWDAAGKPIVVKKNVQLPSSSWSRYACSSTAVVIEPTPEPAATQKVPGKKK
jgi:hypothetical protein